ncbi:MAG: type II secretion system F family protein [Campylobacterales bacterium]|nr:type II secretion system F family protein [Campylobacterales bacterium]
MKYFEVRYRRGQTSKSVVVEAENRLDAMKRFLKLEIGVPIELSEVGEPFSIKVRKFIEKQRDPIKAKRVNNEHYISVLRQLSVMLDAGMPINVCLEETVRSTQDPMLRAIMQTVHEDIEGGQGFTNAIKPFRTQLGNLSVSMIYLGEQTGTLAESIEKLADILQTIHENRIKLKKATRYPMITIFAMAIAFGVVITFVVPQFKDIFAQSGAELPFPTKLLLWIEYALTTYGPFIALGAGVLLAGYLYMYRRNPTWALVSDRLLLRVYIVGAVTKYAMLGRFVYIFNVLIHAGIPIVDALKAAVGVVDNRYMKQQFGRIVEDIEGGQSLYSGFVDAKMFESMILQMLKAGEDSGALNSMLSKITKYYNDKYDNIIDNVSSMIEPILIAAIAGFVLVLALGIFLPMWSMAEAMGM